MKVYYDFARRRWIIKQGRTNTTLGLWSGFARAHELIAMQLGDEFKFYFVFSQPDIREKTLALLKLRELLPDLPRKIGLLFSYALLDSESIQCMRLLKQHGFEIMLDSGAFHVLERKIPLSRYQQYLHQYIDFVNEHLDLIDWFVTMDVPCDARPAKSIQELPNRQKIELTVENTVKIVDRAVDPRRLVAVAQGYNPHEYRYCCELLKQHGLVTARMGVGSLCIRKYNKRERKLVPEILKTVRECLPAWVKLHAFGLNVKFLKHREVVQHLNSSDSDAWVYSYSKYSRLVLCRADGNFVEIDLKEATRDFKFRVNIDKVTIYQYLLLSYIMKLAKLGLVKRGPRHHTKFYTKVFALTCSWSKH